MTTAQPPDVAGTVFDDVDPQLTRNYAEALLNAAGPDQAEEVVAELQELVDDLMVHSRHLRDIMTLPAMKAADRDRILVAALEGRALPTVVRFLRVLNRHGRLGLTASVAREARTLWDRRQNRRPVTVRSAVPLDEGQREALRGRLAAMIAATPIVSYEVDPSLIGGLVVQVGDDVYDTSLRNQLELMRRRLVEGRGREAHARFASTLEG